MRMWYGVDLDKPMYRKNGRWRNCRNKKDEEYEEIREKIWNMVHEITHRGYDMEFTTDNRLEENIEKLTLSCMHFKFDR